LIFNEVNQMKPAEAKVLEGLRKNTLAYLSDKEYAQVVEAVEKQGILGLTGAASRLVKGAVIKHGSHDQKTHGRRGGGGGSGQSNVSGGDAPKRDNSKISNVISKIDDAENKLSDFDASKPGGGQKYDALSENDQSIWEGSQTSMARARRALTGAKSAKTDKEYRSKLTDAAENLDDAFQELQGADSSRLISASRSLEVALDRVDSLFLPREERGGGDRMS